MRMISGLFVATVLGGIMFAFVLINLAMFHKALSTIAFSLPEYLIAGGAASLVFGACMWRVVNGSTAREESDRFFDMLNDPGSSTD